MLAKDMKVGLLKLGKSVCFDPETWKPIGADIEVHMLARALGAACAEVHYWGAYNFGTGKDRSRERARELKIPDNVTFHDPSLCTDSKKHPKLVAELEAVAPDILFVINGPHSGDNRGLIMFEKYSWPVIMLINSCQVPWVYLYSDFRYMLKSVELERAPAEVLTHYPIASQVTNVVASETEVKFDRFPVWAFWRVDSPKVDHPLDGRSRKLRMIGNEKPKYWSEWASKYVPHLGDIDWEVWGNWPSAPPDDPHYRRTNTSISANFHELTDTDHLFIMVTPQAGMSYPFTQRWFEFASSDAVVWINEHYDAFHDMIPSDHFTRVKDGAELLEKIKLVDSSPELRDALVAEQRTRFDSKHESIQFLAETTAKILERVVADPTKTAFDPAVLLGQKTVGYNEMDVPPEQLVGKALLLEDCSDAWRRAGTRVRTLMKILVGAGSVLSFDELYEMARLDPGNQLRGDDEVKYSVAHQFGFLIQKLGAKLVDESELNITRRTSEELMALMPPLSDKKQAVIDSKKTAKSFKKKDQEIEDMEKNEAREQLQAASVGSAILRALMEAVGAQPIHQEEEADEVEKPGTEMVFMPPLDEHYQERDLSAFNSPPAEEPSIEAIAPEEPKVERKKKEPKKSGGKRVPMSERRLIALTDKSQFKPTSNTHAHFMILVEAGPDGISYEDFSRKIDESGTQGVQTGARLAAWNFGDFVRLGIAKQVKVNPDGSFEDFKVPEIKAEAEVAKEPEQNIRKAVDVFEAFPVEPPQSSMTDVPLFEEAVVEAKPKRQRKEPKEPKPKKEKPSDEWVHLNLAADPSAEAPLEDSLVEGSKVQINIGPECTQDCLGSITRVSKKLGASRVRVLGLDSMARRLGADPVDLRSEIPYGIQGMWNSTTTDSDCRIADVWPNDIALYVPAPAESAQVTP